MYLFVRKKWERKFSFAAHAKFLHDSPSQSRKVPNVDDGMRLDKFLRKNFGFPQSLIEKFVRKNKVFFIFEYFFFFFLK